MKKLYFQLFAYTMKSVMTISWYKNYGIFGGIFWTTPFFVVDFLVKKFWNFFGIKIMDFLVYKLWLYKCIQLK